MDMNSTFARVAAGFAVKAIGIGIALWVAVTVVSIVTDAFSQVNTAFERVQTATEAR